MIGREVSLSPARWFGPMVMIIAVTNIAILFDIPVLRQISGFVFLTFVPGFLLLAILKLNKPGLVEKIVLSVGLSIAFSMLFGLALNGSLLAIGYTKPLSNISLLISFSTANIVLAIIAYMRNKDITFTFSSLKLTVREKAFLIIPSLFPLLSIVGMRIMNLTDNNALLMLLLFMIPAYIIFLSFSHRKVSEKVYPAAIFLIGISLLLMYSLRSNHIIGADTHRAFLTFLTTFDNLRWSQLGFGNLDACLSISVLPSIYQTFLNIDQEYLFKLLFSLIFSISPLVVYLLSKKYIGSSYAFLASVFFVSQIIFLRAPAADRITTALLFFSLSIMVLFSDNIGELSKRILFIVFAASIIVSHYGVTFVTFFVLILTWIGMQILSTIVSRKKELATQPAENQAAKDNPPVPPSQEGSSRGSDTLAPKATALEPSQNQFRKAITAGAVALFLATLFFWYALMTGPSFSAGVLFIYNTFKEGLWFLGEVTVEQPVRAAFGQTLAFTGWPQRIEFVFSWLTIVLMSVGLLTVIMRFRTMVSTPFAKHEQPRFLLKRLEAEYLILAMGCFLLLAAVVVLPHVSKFYGIARTYLQMVFILSILVVIGGITVAQYLKVRPYWVILAVLIPYFLCTTGATCQVFDFPRAITLNSEGPLYDRMYVSDEDSYAAKWLEEYRVVGIPMYANGFARDILSSQGKIDYHQIGSRLIENYQEGKPFDGYIYLRHQDLSERGLKDSYPGMFASKSKIYSNGGSEIYRQ